MVEAGFLAKVYPPPADWGSSADTLCYLAFNVTFVVLCRCLVDSRGVAYACARECVYSGVYHVSVTGGRESYGAACVGHGRTLSAALGSFFFCVLR